jgi:putative flippase GtrA
MKLARRLARPSRYAQVGLLCALLNNLIVIGFDRAGYHYAVAVCLAFATVTAVGYLLHAAYTFKVAASGTALLRFFGANLSGFFISLLLMMIMCDGIGLSASVAMPIATVLLFVWNYAFATWAIVGWSQPPQAFSKSSRAPGD